MNARLSWVAAALLPGAAAIAADRWELPVAVQHLDNGLTVVVSEDHTSPTFGATVVYKVGMRLEPRGRTGFAHLFEHLMFEGTPNAPKGTFDRVIEGGGGVNNGSTRTDYTNYIESAPVSALEPILWLEADRMKTLAFTPETLKNQRDVVKEEIRVNVKNQPYSLFFWLDMVGLMFDRWENKHDGYGSFADLDNAKLEDVRAFHASFYSPGNAVLALAGDVKAADAFALVHKYFDRLPARQGPPRPEVDEGLNTQERRLAETDALARVPALAVAWKAPARASADQAPAAVLAQLLTGDDASRLYLALVKGKQLMINIDGGVNWPLGSAWDYAGPAPLTIYGLYKPAGNADAILTVMDAEIARIVKDGVPPADLVRVKTKMLADYYNDLESFINRSNTLAKFQALWGDATTVNRVPGLIDAVTGADVQRVAATYLTHANRSVIDRKPAAAAAATGAKP